MANVWVHFMLLPKFAGKPLLALFFISCPCYPCGLLLAKASQVTVCGVRDHDPDLDLDRDLDPDLDRDHDPVEGGASLLLFVCFRLSGRLVKNNLAISGSRRVLPQAYQDNDDNQVRPVFFCWFPAWLLVWFFFVLSHPGPLSSFLFLFFVTPPGPIYGTAPMSSVLVFAVAVVPQSCAVENATILSTAEEPSRVTCGSSVTSSLLQEGVTVDRGCIVSDSLLMEHSHVDNHGKVREEGGTGGEEGREL